MTTKRYAFTLETKLYDRLAKAATADRRSPSQMLEFMIDRWADLTAAALTGATTATTQPKTLNTSKTPSRGPQDFLDYVVLPDGRVFCQDPVPIWYLGQPQEREREYKFVEQTVDLATGEFDVDDGVWSAWHRTDREARDRVEALDTFVKNECLNWRAETFRTEAEVFARLSNAE